MDAVSSDDLLSIRAGSNVPLKPRLQVTMLIDFTFTAHRFPYLLSLAREESGISGSMFLGLGGLQAPQKTGQEKFNPELQPYSPYSPL